MKAAMRRAALAAAVVTTSLALAGCGSARFGGPGPRIAARPAPEPYNAPEPVPALPSSPVISEPLAPPPGASAAPTLESGPTADVPVMPGSPRPVETMVPAAPPREAAPGSSRSTAIGGWTAKDATGATCRVQLSSTSALDRYRASTSGCANGELSRITAWDFQDGEVFLYQQGGAVAARLRSGGGSLSGVLAKSGAPLTLTK